MFYDPLRAALARYAAGVHEVGDPAGEPLLAATAARLGRALPSALANLYRSWNGLWLFCDSFTIASAEALTSEGELLRLGEALGAPLFLDPAGRVYEADELGDRRLVGSSLERWLAALLLREALLVDREGEFRDVFDGDGLKAQVREKRVRAGLKADPDAGAWQEEAAELAFEAGDQERARAALERAVAADPGCGSAWELLGGLARQKGRPAEALAAYLRAAETTVNEERRRERLAEAARAASEAGDESERAQAAERALAGGAAFVDGWLAEARERESQGDVEGALNLATLAAALAPDGEAASLARRLRAHARLRPID